MTKVSVNTGPLSGTASRLQALAREADQRAVAVDGVLRGLDMRISARQHFDQRLRSLSLNLRAQSRAVADQARFLAYAASRYESAENATRSQVPAGRPPAAGEAHVGGASSTRPVVGWDEPQTRLPIGDIVGFGLTLLDKSKRIRGIGKVGDVLSVGELIIQASQGDYSGAAFGTLGFVPFLGQFISGYKVGTFIATDDTVQTWAIDQIPGAEGWAPRDASPSAWIIGQVPGADGWAPNWRSFDIQNWAYDHVVGADGWRPNHSSGIQGWLIGQVAGADGWAPNFDTLGIGDGVVGIEDGLSTAVHSTWDWVSSRWR